MAALGRLQTSDCTNPVLDIYTAVNGVLTDIYSAEFQIFDATGSEPVQVYPVTPDDRVPVDVSDFCPVGGKLSVGRYVAQWMPAVDANVGTYQIRWFFKIASNSAEQTFTEEFEVLVDVVGSGTAVGYCLLQDMRDEGVTTQQADDAWLVKKIVLASKFIESVTKRSFIPQPKTLKVDGRGRNKILLTEPIIAISSVQFETAPFYPSSLEIDMSLLRVYNRHLTQGLLEPDDRNNPKIELFVPSTSLQVDSSFRRSWTGLVFPEGQQNIIIDGIFGYTDPDGANSAGKTPDLITHVCKLIVMKEMVKMGRVGARFDARNRIRITSERTRDQQYTLEPLGTMRGAFFTGDPEIDGILAFFQRPPGLGAA